MKKIKIKELLHELKHHLPFTALATLTALLIAFFMRNIFTNFSEEIFESFHFFHLVLAAITASAMFFKYKKNKAKAVIIGVLSSVFLGSLSDILLPYIGSFIFNLNPEFHLPIIKTPLTVIALSLFGGLIGAIFKKTKIPHFLHVWISVFASIFYLFLC